MRLFFIFFILVSSWARADFDLTQINFGLGMANVSFQESPSGLPPRTTGSVTTQEQPSSGSVPSICAFIDYEKFLGAKYSYVIKSALPLMASSTGSYLSAGGGINYYLNSLSSVGMFETREANFQIIPKWRYHVGGGLSGAYLIYNTETAKRNDTLVELYGNAGVTMTKNKDWGYRAEAIFARGVGFNSSAIVMKFFAGLAYTFN